MKNAWARTRIIPGGATCLSFAAFCLILPLLLLPRPAAPDTLELNDGSTHDLVWVESVSFGAAVVFSVRPLDGTADRGFPVPAANVSSLTFGTPEGQQGRSANLLLSDGRQFPGVTVMNFRSGQFEVAPAGQPNAFPVATDQIQSLTFTGQPPAPAMSSTPSPTPPSSGLPPDPMGNNAFGSPGGGFGQDMQDDSMSDEDMEAALDDMFGGWDDEFASEEPSLLVLSGMLLLVLGTLICWIWYMVAVWREAGPWALLVFVPCVGGFISIYYAIKYMGTAGLPFLLSALMGVAVQLLAWKYGI